MRLENFLAAENKQRDDDIVYPTNGVTVCFGYLMAVRGWIGVVDGTVDLARAATADYTSVCQKTALTHRY